MSSTGVPAVALALVMMVATCAATIVVELGLAVLLLGVRDRHDVAVVALAQVVTNPVVEFGCLLAHWSPRLPLTSPAWTAIIALEAAAVVVEAWLYRVSGTFERPWLASLLLNVASFALGCAISLLV